MKRTIKLALGGVIAAGFTALLLVNFGKSVGGYMDFARAESSGARAHVVGFWVPERGTRFDLARAEFSFWMRDEVGNLRRVVYTGPKPAGFEDAERIVVEGRMQEGIFYADRILIKCPSKYNDQVPSGRSATSM